MQRQKTSTKKVKIIKTIAFIQQKELKEVITDHIKTSAIFYCFGSNKTVYNWNKTLYQDKEVQEEHIYLYLLVLVQETKENVSSDICDKIKTKTHGFITAITVIAETDGFANIGGRRQLVSYVGLDVIMKESGTLS